MQRRPKSQIIANEEARDWLIQELHGAVEFADALLEAAWHNGFKLVPLDEHDIAMGEAA